MKEYHINIVIKAPVGAVWKALTNFSAYPEWNPLVGWLKGDIRANGQIQMFIKPLNRSFTATLKRVEPDEELTWVGVQLASWIISGEHYYRLEALDRNSTRLSHGEYFRGLASAFIGKATLERMEAAFNRHNVLLKERVEHE